MELVLLRESLKCSTRVIQEKYDLCISQPGWNLTFPPLIVLKKKDIQNICQKIKISIRPLP